jgi:hypothetical protein
MESFSDSQLLLLLSQFSNWVNILPFYGYRSKTKYLMQALCKRTNSAWEKNWHLYRIENDPPVITDMDYDSVHYEILKTWRKKKKKKHYYGGKISSIYLFMSKVKDVNLLKLLRWFSLPPCWGLYLNDLPDKHLKLTNHFLSYCFPKRIRVLQLNCGSKELVDGSKYIKSIANVIPKVIARVSLYKFEFTKEHVEIIVNASMNLDLLRFSRCKLPTPSVLTDATFYEFDTNAKWKLRQLSVLMDKDHIEQTREVLDYLLSGMAKTDIKHSLRFIQVKHEAISWEEVRSLAEMHGFDSLKRVYYQGLAA